MKLIRIQSLSLNKINKSKKRYTHLIQFGQGSIQENIFLLI